MSINFHDLMAFFHVVLFVYAIGGDIAVYYIGNYITNDQLSIEERLRVRSMRFLVDMSARTSLVLLLPIGFTLGTTFGSEIDGSSLTIIWMFSFLWLGLIWMVHFKKDTETGEVEVLFEERLNTYIDLQRLELMDNGNILPCCPTWVNHYSIGNIN